MSTLYLIAQQSVFIYGLDIDILNANFYYHYYNLFFRKADERFVQLSPFVHLLLQKIDQLQEKDAQQIFAEPVDFEEVIKLHFLFVHHSITFFSLSFAKDGVRMTLAFFFFLTI